MDRSISQLSPRDIRLVNAVVNYFISGRLFDKLRREVLADIVTKPDFHTLRQSVNTHVKTFLGRNTWKSDMNRSQIRECVQRNIQESDFLNTGIDAIIKEIVNPKYIPFILRRVQDALYAYLNIEKFMNDPKDYNKSNLDHGLYNQDLLTYRGLPPHLQVEDDNIVESMDSSRIPSERVPADIGNISFHQTESLNDVMKLGNDKKNQTDSFHKQYIDRVIANASNITTLPSYLNVSLGKIDSAGSLKEELDMDVLRSCRSTFPQDEQPSLSQNFAEYEKSLTISKDLSTADTISTVYGNFGSGASTSMVVSSVNSRISLGTDPCKESSENPLSKHAQDSISLQTPELDDFSCFSTISTPKEMDKNNENVRTLESTFTDSKSKVSCRKCYKHKDGKHCKLGGDHASHRQRDKNIKVGHNPDKGRRSKSRHHSKSSHRHKTKDRREKSSHHRSSHKSDRHGESYKSNHHSSHRCREKSTRRSSKYKSKCVDSNDVIKLSNSSSNSKIFEHKTNLPIPSNDSACNSLTVDKSSRIPKETRQSNQNIFLDNRSPNLNDGEFIKSKRIVDNKIREKPKSLLSNVSSKKRKADSKSLPVKPKDTFDLEGDIKLIGNPNKKIKRYKSKILREQNINITMNKTQSVEVFGKIQKIKRKNISENSAEQISKFISKPIEERKVNETSLSFRKRNINRSEIKSIKNVQISPSRNLMINQNISPNRRSKILQEKANIATNNPHLVVRSSKTDKKGQVIDDRDNRTNFESPPKRIRVDPPYLSSKYNFLRFDFEGFPDIFPVPENKLRSYLNKMTTERQLHSL